MKNFLFVVWFSVVAFGIVYVVEYMPTNRIPKACDISVELTRDEYKVTYRGPKSRKSNNKDYEPLGNKGLNPNHTRPTIEVKDNL